ncbi:uncharacterized protein [Ptychodera flava]|uniref:uncharacterized protein n=1 Tax=Ptychodera flava TaxID=63121 RepID=UPI00396A2F72
MARCLVGRLLLINILFGLSFGFFIERRDVDVVIAKRADTDNEDEELYIGYDDGDDDNGITKRAAEEKPTTTYFYLLNDDSGLTWEQANRYCMDRQGRLVTVSDDKTRDYLAGWIPRKSSEELFYLGMEYDDRNDKWQYYNRTEARYFNWAEGEPSPTGDKKCAVISSSNDYKWLAHSCDVGPGYICQFDCKRDPFWCVRGTVRHTEDTCSCDCKAGWRGLFCDIVVDPVYTYNGASEKATFDAAEEQCSKLHGQLPSVADEKSVIGLQAYVNRKSSLKGATMLIDLKLKGGRWIDSRRQTPDVLNWKANEPQAGKECVGIDTGKDNRWVSLDCSEPQKYVCEFSCRKAREDWCVHGDVIINSKGTCNCRCWPGSFGDYCEEYDYSEVIHKTLLFYETQRSGILPPDNRIPWRGDSALMDMGRNGEDLTGGWYDAGDHIKVTYKHTATVWKLAWSFLEFKDAYEEAGEVDFFYRCLRWGNDYTMKLHTKPNEFYAHVADPALDHKYWGRAEDMTMPRPSYPVNETHPATEVAGNGAASLAASYMVFKDVDPAYANEMLRHAKELYEFAYNFRGTFEESIPEVPFLSGSYGDELVNAGLWLYMATGDEYYKECAERHFDEFDVKRPDPLFTRNRISLPVQLMMYVSTGNTKYLKSLEKALDRWFPGSRYVTYSPRGLAVISSQRPIKKCADSAFVALVAAKHGVNSQKYIQWARQQVHYILGDTGRSFLTGFGKNPPVRPHHRSSSCPPIPKPCGRAERDSADPNPHTLYGGLTGGPDDRDNFFDHRRNYLQTECGINVAGFQGAIAGLSHFRMMERRCSERFGFR